MDNKELRKLQREWDAKLRKEGFDDIEVTHDGRRQDGSPYIKRHSGHMKRRHDRGLWFRDEEWYRLAQQWTHERTWGPKEKWKMVAWELLASGATFTEVWRKIKSRKMGDYRHVKEHKLKKFFTEENERMRLELVREPHARTACAGEKVYLVGMLEDTVDDYRWEVRLTDGQVIEVDEDTVRYGKP